MKFNKEKMKQVTHYIIHKCGCKCNVGKNVLFKLLYFSDFDYYELNEVPITNESYIKYPKGLVPSHFDEIKNELINEGMINEKIVPVFPNSKYKKCNYSSINKLKTDLINSNERKIIDLTINKLSHMTAQKISDYSHDDMPWGAAEDYRELDYEFVFYRNPPYAVRTLSNLLII